MAMIAAGSRTIVWAIARTVAGLLGALFAWYGVWYALNLFGGVGISKNFGLFPIPLFALTVAGVLLVFAALAGRQTARLSLLSVLLGGLILGGASFFVGFVGRSSSACCSGRMLLRVRCWGSLSRDRSDSSLAAL